MPTVHLDALDGLSFILQIDGTISGVGSPRWDNFARSNAAPELAASRVLGRNLYEFISGDEVKQHLQTFLHQLSSMQRSSLVVPFRCDAPNMQRNMRQAITPIMKGDVCQGFLFQSVDLDHRQRPPLDIFDFKAIAAKVSQNSNLPIVTMCSWCQRLLNSSVDGDVWLEAEAYYAAGGSSQVQISHGLCSDCKSIAYDRNSG